MPRSKTLPFGLVGTVEAVDPTLPRCLLDAGFVPVVAPVASGPDCKALNINADTAAGALAGAIGAEYFVLISYRARVLDGEGSLYPASTAKKFSICAMPGYCQGHDSWRGLPQRSGRWLPARPDS